MGVESTRLVLHPDPPEIRLRMVIGKEGLRHWQSGEFVVWHDSGLIGIFGLAGLFVHVEGEPRPGASLLLHSNPCDCAAPSTFVLRDDGVWMHRESSLVVNVKSESGEFFSSFFCWERLTSTRFCFPVLWLRWTFNVDLDFFSRTDGERYLVLESESAEPVDDSLGEALLAAKEKTISKFSSGITMQGWLDKEVEKIIELILGNNVHEF